VDILFCTDGSNSSIQTATLVSKLGFSPQTRIVILGVSESNGDVEKLKISMNQVEQQLAHKYSINIKLRYGSAIEEILTEAIEGKYNLVTVGGGGNQLGLLNPLVGKTTKKLARKLSTHFLVGRNIPKEISKILFCIGSVTPTNDTVKLGAEWISSLSAHVGLLHVISKAKDDQTHKSEFKQSASKIIDRSIQQLNAAGIKSEITTRIRQGLVVDEVLNELTEGGYELLVVGSHYQPGQDRWQGTLLDDITDQLLNRANCSMLII
jgi:nucleotide-binding universal stress UspA family protein